MPSFRDSKGRDWPIEITLDELRRVRNWNREFDLGNPYNGHPTIMERLSMDYLDFVDVLYLSVKPLADDRKMDSEQFGRELGLERVEEARAAFFEAWEGFFLRCGRADAVAALKKQTVLVPLALAKALAEVDAIDLSKLTPTKPASRSPESSESNLGDGRSATS